MVFSSLLFIYFFLPLVIFLYYIVRDNYKNLVLAISSLIFIYLGDQKYFYILIAIASLSFLYGIFYIKVESKKYRKIGLIISSLIIFSTLFFFKYFDFIASSLNNITNSNIKLLNLALPLGISFYIFQASSYIFDVYRETTKPEKSLINFLAYLAFFPQLIAGPIVQYVEIKDELHNKKYDIDKIVDGIYQFVLGLGKKVLIANQLGLIISSVSDDRLSIWLKSLAFTLQLYFDFSGYSDMAIGLGKIFGFTFPKNFNYPFISKSVTEFWRRWHISLGRWFREYVYIPMGGNRVSKARWILNILVVWFLTGLWHGASWNFVLWGLIMAFFLFIEKLFKNTLEKIPSFIRILFTFLIINFSFVVFNYTDLNRSISDILVMIGVNGTNNISQISRFVFFDNIILLITAFLLSAPIYPKLIERYIENTRYEYLIKLIITMIIIILSTAYLVNDSFNPFLYFRF